MARILIEDPAESIQSAGERSAATRQAILDAARDLFAANGYSATSIADIVDRAGTSVGLPYYHFGSKKKIFLAIWEEYLADQEARTKAAVTQARQKQVDGPDVLLAAIRAYLEGAWAHRQIQPLLYKSDKPSGFDTVLDRAHDVFLHRNERLLADLGKHRSHVAAVIVVNAMRGLCVELAECSTAREARRLMDTGLDLLAQMLHTDRHEQVPPQQIPAQEVGT